MSTLDGLKRNLPINIGILSIAGSYLKSTAGIFRLGRHQWRTVADAFWRPHIRLLGKTQEGRMISLSVVWSTDMHENEGQNLLRMLGAVERRSTGVDKAITKSAILCLALDTYL